MNSELNDQSVDLQAVVSGAAADSGVPHSHELLEFADAVVSRSAELGRRRADLQAATSAGALVDAACVVANFQRMVRIADGTGIPLDKPVALLSADLRESLALDAFGSAEQTPTVRPLSRALGRLMRPLMIRRLRKNRT